MEDIVQLKRSIFKSDALTQLRFFPEVDRVLQELIARGHILAIASMNSEVLIREVLSRANMATYFNYIVGQESVKKKQPNPEILEHVLELIPVPRRNFVVVGDSLNDYEAARLAGIRFIYCQRERNTWEEDIRNPWKKVENLAQVLEIEM